MKYFVDNYYNRTKTVQTDIFVVSYGDNYPPAMDAFKSQACADRALESLNKEANEDRHYQILDRSQAIIYALYHGRKLPTFFSDEYYTL